MIKQITCVDKMSRFFAIVTVNKPGSNANASNFSSKLKFTMDIPCDLLTWSATANKMLILYRQKLSVTEGSNFITIIVQSLLMGKTLAL